MLFTIRQECEFARFEQAVDKTLDQRLFQYVLFALFLVLG